uniref:uncharacterized protein LOC124040681 n=1 Tax=Oncorhynchus gorbuscha TaxID=8017 RepID=UPI001EAF6CF1|nr:uncharacterized protein LOC124040681 [Oncorhynchus gorbuscha]
MKNWSKIFKSGDPESVDGNSSSKRISSNNGPAELTPQRTFEDNLSHDANSTPHSSITPPHVQGEGDGEDEGTLKGRLRTLLLQSWGSILHKLGKGDADSDLSFNGVKIVPNGSRVSPPVSPIIERRYWDTQDSLGTSSKSSRRPLLRDSPIDNDQLHYLPEESELTSIHPAEYYAEKVEVYKLKYSYMKSWPGLLRLLAGFELLFGGMVLACVCAYIYKDSEWSNAYGLYNNSHGMSGNSYNGPMTPFVMAVVGVTWIVTILLLVIGLTMYYRTILLDSPWWPLTEGIINVALFLLYMAAGIVYLNDLKRGGLCYMTIGINPIMSSLCRVDGGQMAGTAFIFINMLLYLISFLVCLKMWRHEATRREMEFFESQEHLRSISVAQTKPPHPQIKRIVFKDEIDSSVRATKRLHITDFHQEEPGSRNRANPTGYAEKPRVVADYIIKYPEIFSMEEREKYKAVFNDQYQEYKDLHKDISTTFMKFRELDVMMGKLLKDGNSHEEQKRIQRILKKYEQNKSNPAFLEKKGRCDYLKAKLGHIKNRIRNFDQDSLAKVMYEQRHYDNPPIYSPPYTATSNGFYTHRSVHSPRSNFDPYPPPPDSFYMEDRPQHFYKWFSAPGLVKTMEGATVILCFLIFACVASTLVWDMHGAGIGMGGYGTGSMGIGSGTGGYYGGSYGYSSSYMTPYSAKSAMISMAAINFLVSLGFLVGSFSRSPAMRGRRFYLTVLVCDVVLAVLQGIIDIVFVIGVNPMSQSSQSMLYNPMLMMCQNMQGSPSLSGSVGAGFPGGFPMYNQYLQHYCYMDPEEAVALVLGFLVVVALCVAAYYAYKTRSKIWRHGKPNIIWDRPLLRPPERNDVQNWVDYVAEGQSTQRAPTVILSEKTVPDLRTENSVVSDGAGTVSIYSEETYNGNVYYDNTNGRVPEPLYRHTRVSSSPSVEAESLKKYPIHRERERDPTPPSQEETQCETGYTTGGDTGNELDQDQSDHMHSMRPEITSDRQRRQYKKEFDSDLASYKSLCAEMDDISEQMHKLSRELDTLEEGTAKHQAVADEYNLLKVLKRTADYQAKKQRSKDLRQNLFHIKRLVKNYDNGLC